jgi:hypothetical protein
MDKSGSSRLAAGNDIDLEEVQAQGVGCLPDSFDRNRAAQAPEARDKKPHLGSRIEPMSGR